MTAHVGDEIAGLLRGDVRRPVAIASTAHLRVCEDCRDELITAFAAHVALMSAARLLGETEPVTDRASAEFPVPVISSPVPELTLPELTLPQVTLPRVTLPQVTLPQVTLPQSTLPQVTLPQVTLPRVTLPELTLPELTRRRRLVPRAAPSLGTRLSRSHRIRPVHGIAGAAALVAAAVVAALVVSGGSSSQSVALSAYGVGTSNAAATLASAHELDIEANLPALEPGGYYEVWLTDAGRTVMTPVGALDQTGRTALSLSPETVAQYSDIEVSVQSPENGTAYSGVSVLRGPYKRA